MIGKILLVMIFLAIALSAWAQKQVVRVGGYSFPPFVDTDEAGNIVGLTIDMIEAMNRSQKEYEFTFFFTSPRRRYDFFMNNRYDLVLFEDKKWGWKQYPVESSKVFLEGGEVFIAKKKPGRTQEFFDDVKSKSIVGFLGYHYGFADFNSDPAYLRENFNITLSTDHRKNINMVLHDRADIAIVTKSFLSMVLREKPQTVDELLVSGRMDQVYNHSILVRQGASPGVSWLNDLLEKMEKDGTLGRLFEKYGLKAASFKDSL